MSGSNIFVVYTSANGKNVTVSPRLGTGYAEPQHDTNAQIQVLAGSGVSNGVMTANVKCSNCNSWSGGSMDFSGSSASWIYGYKSGSQLKSDDPGASIRQHDQSDSFKWELSKAKGGDDVNPFVSNAAATTRASAGTGAATATSMSSGGVTTDTGSATFGNSSDGGSASKTDTLITAHGVLASLAFVALFPIGSILIRIASFTGLIWVHAVFQLVAYGIYIVAFGMGVYLATELNYMSNHHPVIGIVLLVVLLTQPITGFIHHRLFKKNGSRTGTSYMHLWIGRGAILLGIINGGLGLQLAEEGNTAKIAYAVVAAIIGVVYVACAVMGEMKRKKGPRFYGNVNRQLNSQDGHGISMETYGPNKERR